MVAGSASDVRRMAYQECQRRGLALKFLKLDEFGRWYFRAQAWEAGKLLATVQGYLGNNGLVIVKQSVPETPDERAERIARRWARQGGV